MTPQSKNRAIHHALLLLASVLLLSSHPVTGLRQSADSLMHHTRWVSKPKQQVEQQPWRALGGKRGKAGSKGKDEEEPECDSQVQTITTTLIVNLEGVQPENLDETRRTALEEAFLISYNNLSETLCEGDSFRVILSVTLDVDVTDSNRRLDNQRSLLFGFRPFVFFYNIVWGCNNLCPADSNLLMDDAGRRRLEDDLERHKGGDSKDEDGNVCILACETPTPEVFIVNYGNVIEEFEEELNITLATPTAVTELKIIEDCQVDDVQIQETAITVPFAGDPDAATEQELATLAEGVLLTLNNLNTLNPDTCDTFFRVVLSVEAVVNSASDFSRRSLKFGSKKRTGIVFNVVWQCQNTCPQGANLLGNDAGRRRLHATSNHLALPIRFLQTAPGECRCPVGDVEFRPPTRDEFNEAFNETLTTLIDENEVTFVDEVGDSTEAEEISCPTEVDVRESFVAVEVDADPDQIQDKDVEALVNIIFATYTDLTSRLCNPDVRTIIEVVFVQVVESGSSDDSTNRNLLFKKKSTFVYNIVFNCPFCPNDAGLLSNDAGRRLASSADYSKSWVPRGVFYKV